MCPVAGEQEESSGVVDVFEPLAGLLCTLTPQAHLWGLLRPAGSLFWGLLADFRHQKEMLLKIQQITAQQAIFQAGKRKYFQALCCCNVGTHLLPLTLLTGSGLGTTTNALKSQSKAQPDLETTLHKAGQVSPAKWWMNHVRIIDGYS